MDFLYKGVRGCAMTNPFDMAWSFLKSVDFQDVGPMPSTFNFQPGTPEYESNPDYHQSWMEETYMPDLEKVLEAQALRQAMGTDAGDKRRNVFQMQQFLPDNNFATDWGYNIPQSERMNAQ